MNKKFSAALFVLLACFQSSVCAKAKIVDVTTLDVAGVKLGMTPDETRQALTTKGFQVSDDDKYLSWNAQVVAEAGKYINTPKDTTQAIWSTKAEGPDFQTVSVSYQVSSKGSHVKEVRYTRPARLGNILHLAAERYGPPTQVHMNLYHYCPEVKGCPTSFLEKADFPFMEVYHPYSESGQSSIVLNQGTAAERHWAAEFRAAVIVIAPNYGKAGF